MIDVDCRKVLGNNQNLPVTGDKIRLPVLARTLEIIGNSPRGAMELYDGSITASFVSDLDRMGSIITANDLKTYRCVFLLFYL